MLTDEVGAYLDEQLANDFEKGQQATAPICDFVLYLYVMKGVDIEELEKWIESRYSKAELGEYKKKEEE